MRESQPKTFPRSDHGVSVSRPRYHGRTNLGVNHETKHVLNAVKGKNATISAFPETFVVGTSAFNRRSQLVDVFWIGDSDLKIRTLLVSLEAVKVLAEKHLYRVDCRLMLSEMGLEICLVRLAVVLLE